MACSKYFSFCSLVKCCCAHEFSFRILEALRLMPPSLRGFGFATTSLNGIGLLSINRRNTASNFDLSTIRSLMSHPVVMQRTAQTFRTAHTAVPAVVVLQE